MLRVKQYAFNFIGAYPRTITAHFNDGIFAPPCDQHLCGLVTLASAYLGRIGYYDYLTAPQNLRMENKKKAQ